MGDRFYQQQLDALGTCPGFIGKRARKRGYGSSSTPKAPRLTKKDLAAELGIAGIDKLLMPCLDTLIRTPYTGDGLVMPTGRLKQPYIDSLVAFYPQVDWSKCTVATLKAAINNFNGA